MQALVMPSRSNILEGNIDSQLNLTSIDYLFDNQFTQEFLP